MTRDQYRAFVVATKKQQRPTAKLIHFLINYRSNTRERYHPIFKSSLWKLKGRGLMWGPAGVRYFLKDCGDLYKKFEQPNHNTKDVMYLKVNVLINAAPKQINVTIGHDNFVANAINAEI